LHRNTVIDSPRLLDEYLRLRKEPRVLFAGQLTGVEGYVEAAAMGLLAGINAARIIQGKPLIPPPRSTAFGALIGHITNTFSPQFQPMGINFGLFPPLDKRVGKRQRRALIVERALRDLERWKEELEG
ncbi:MAG: methylenetetrahydrofolate--tRNA-(uracil(54)-C(5))-methyltransferase (FADH(2)-oxidizing) TrmFO, partial [Deltaproteobacteria bacterium]